MRSPGSIAASKRFDTGDRTLYLAEVVTATLVRDEKPLSLGRLLRIAPREKLDLLREQMQADSTHDEQEIARWREVHLKESRLTLRPVNVRCLTECGLSGFHQRFRKGRMCVDCLGNIAGDGGRLNRQHAFGN